MIYLSHCLIVYTLKNGEIIVKFESYYTNGKGPKNWMGLLRPPTFQGRHYGTIGPNFMDLLKLPHKLPHSRRKQMDFETPSFKTPPCFMFLIISIVILSTCKFLTFVSMILAGLLWVFWCKCRSHSEIKMKLLKKNIFPDPHSNKKIHSLKPL